MPLDVESGGSWDKVTPKLLKGEICGSNFHAFGKKNGLVYSLDSNKPRDKESLAFCCVSFPSQNEMTPKFLFISRLCFVYKSYLLS